MATASLSVARLRIPAQSTRAVTARLAAEALLGEVATTVPGCAPQSVLMLRSMAITVPSMALKRLPDAALRQRFGATARGALQDAVHRALRPALDSVTHQADAVLFTDESELLACLARDALHGRLQCWWWRTLLGARFPDWTTAFVQRPQAVPAALRLLAHQGLGPATLEAMPHLFSMRALTNLALPDRDHANERAVNRVEHTASSQKTSRAEDGRAAPSHSEQPSLQRVMAEVPTQASERLATLAHRPLPTAMVQTEPTAQQPSSSSANDALSLSNDLDTLGVDQTEHGEFGFKSEPHSTRGMATTSSISPPDGMEEAAALVRQSLPAQASKTDVIFATLTASSPLPAQANPTDPKTMPLAEAILAASQGRSLGPVARKTGTVLTDSMNAPSPTQSPKQRPAPVAPIGQPLLEETWPPAIHFTPIRTQFGGLFFLINVMLGQGLYPDFTEPLSPGFPVPLWRLLALVSLRLLGPTLREDPVWPLLQTLDDSPVREGAGDLFELWSPPDEPTHQQPKSKQRHRDPFKPWLSAFVTWMRRELADHLGWSIRQAAHRLLTTEAQVWVSAGEIVVVLPLQHHPVEARLAGLDRNPGFLPSTGRSLRFVFE